MPSAGLIGSSDAPAWSPDGTEIAFSGSPPRRPQLRDVWAVQAADGSGLRRVTQLAGAELAPAYQPYTDLVLTLTSSAVVGDAATLTATVTNAGPGLVTSATVTFQLPAGMTTSAPPGCDVAGQVVTCEITDLLPSGTSTDVALPVGHVGAAGTPTVSGVAETPTPERTVDNNTATVDVGGAGDVGVSVTLSKPEAFVGGRPVTATITVRNTGTVAANDVRLTVTFPAAVVTTGLAPCAAPTGTCALPPIARGTPLVLTARLDPSVVFEGPPRPGAVTATVARTSPDANPADDTASAPLVVRRPHVVLTPTVARPGEVVFAVGTDFPTGEDVNLAWSRGLISVAKPLVRPDGTWTLPILVLRDTQLAPRDLDVRNGQPSPAYGDVTAPLLVVPTSADAPTFLFRK
jgi:uncharacterized repeat protein (TIGR01451 family)